MAAGDILDVQSNGELPAGTDVDLTFAVSVPSGSSVLVAASAWHVTLAPSTTSVTDNLGNTYTLIASEGNANPNGQRFYLATHVTGGTLTVTVHSIDFVQAFAYAFRGTLSYNGDIVANTGTVTPATIGPTVVAPPASSWAIAFGTSDSDTSLTITDAGWNVVGDHGFSSDMATRSTYTQASGFPGHRIVSQVKRTTTVESSSFTVTGTANWKTVILSFAVSSPAVVVYEDPCEIEDPRIFTVITTEDETLKFGIHPLRDSAALGGYAEPRLLDLGDITRQASDPSTGAWSAQTASTKFADTDRENRARSSTRFGFRNCTQEIYITGNAQRLADLPPRVLFAGTVNADHADENLVWTTQINDLIGTSYSLFSEEKQIPQRQVGLSHFPNAAKDVLGLGEPIVGGRAAPLSATDGEGILDTLTVGRITLNGTPGTPTGTTLAAIVADMNTSGAAGTIYDDWTPNIGYDDANQLQAYYDDNGTVPTDYDGLAGIIGGADLDALLAEEAVTGGSVYIAVLVAGHAISEILTGLNSDPSVWINDTQLDPAQLGTQWWAPQIPGDATWASEFSADQFTDILGTDGTTRRYTLILFAPGSTYGDLVEDGGRVHLDCIGLEDVGDGTGDPIYDAFELYRHLLVNFILQSYLTGAWLSVPTFLFSDGTTQIDRVDLASFDTASEIADLQSTGGRIGRFKIGDRTSVRDIIARCNLSWGCLLGQDDYGQLFVRILDTRRTEFLTGRFTATEHRVLRDKIDFLPNFRVESKPDWQVNQLFYEYAPRYYQGDLERPSGGGGVSPMEYLAGQATDGVLTKTIQLPYVQDDRTAQVVAQYYVDLFGKLPRVVSYARRGLCSLEDDVCDGVPITHYNGFGASGWSDHAVWILSKTFHPRQLYCSFTALDVDGLLDVAAETSFLVSDPVALEDLVSDDGSGDLLIAG